jgi:acyl-CoA-binding protein
LLPVSDQLPAVQEDRELFNNDADNHDDIQASPEFSPDDDNQSDDYYSVRSFFENDDTNDHYLIQESENHQLSGDLSADFLHGAFLLFEKVKRIPIRDFPKLRQYSRLYALYKQAAIGEAPTTSPPVYKAVEHAKWKLWKDMRGKITAIEAQLAFLEELDRLLPNWREDPMLNGYNDAIIFAEIDRGRKERAKLK